MHLNCNLMFYCKMEIFVLYDELYWFLISTNKDFELEFEFEYA